MDTRMDEIEGRMTRAWAKVAGVFRPRHDRNTDKAKDLIDSVDQEAREVVLGIDNSVKPDESYPGIC